MEYVGQVNDLAKKLAPLGMTYTYHNHSHEFLPNGSGQIIHEELQKRTSLLFEIDTYWAYNAGVDPIALLTKLSDRVRLIHIKDTYAVEMYPMLDGTDVYIGAIKDAKFGHQIFFGLGGIFIEVLKDVQSALAPITAAEAKEMLTHLRGYKILQGVRGQEAVNIDMYADQIARVSALVQAAPEIAEMDLNPLLGNPRYVTAVDARIRLEK